LVEKDIPVYNLGLFITTTKSFVVQVPGFQRTWFARCSLHYLLYPFTLALPFYFLSNHSWLDTF